MDSGAHPVNPYSPRRISGCFDAFVQNTQATQDPSTWMTTLTCLRNQKGYLEDVLSKTSTTLNALRDRQTRNERALSTNPTPRSRKKKILQNRWRTDKTIKTCENEERVVLDCLHVCQNNISTLESIIHPTDTSSIAAENTSSPYQSYWDTNPTSTDFDWNGWADDGGISPFQRACQRPMSRDGISPEAGLENAALGVPVTTGKRLRRLPPRSRPPLQASDMVPPPPPNTAYTQFHSTLSPEAACFEPSVMHNAPHVVEQGRKELDKLSISGLLASKRVQKIQLEQKRRFSDAAIGHMFRRLSENPRTRPSVERGRQHSTWGPEGWQTQVDRDAIRAAMTRAQSV